MPDSSSATQVAAPTTEVRAPPQRSPSRRAPPRTDQAAEQRRDLDRLDVDGCDHDEREHVVDDDDREHECPQAVGKPPAEQREQAEREGRVGRHRDAPALGGRAPEVEGEEIDRRRHPADCGKQRQREPSCSRSSPRSNSRLASSPSTKKKNVISPLFTHSRSSSATPAPPRSIASMVLHSPS